MNASQQMSPERLNWSVFTNEAERLLDAFEAAWKTASPPDLDFYFRTAATLPGDEPQRVAFELALIDIEQRWKKENSIAGANGETTGALGNVPRIDDYCKRFSLLADTASLPPDVVAEEYRIRRRWGDRPNHDHFLSRFPHLRRELLPRLRAIDAELSADGHAAAPDAVHRPSPLPAATLSYSDYVLLELVGRGGMGKIYRAKQKSTGRIVAVKALHKSQQRDWRAVQRFTSEAEIVARLDHPAIVPVHGVGQFPGGGVFLVLDFIDGTDLERRLKLGALPWQTIVYVALAVSRAIEHAHASGVVHCDLKPSNILLRPAGDVLVTDFGFAQLLPTAADPQPRRFAPGGTAAFMPPEQRVDGQPPAATLDVYGIGAVIRAMLATSGRSSLADVEPMPRDDAAALDRIASTCMAQRPIDRYPSAAAVVAAISLL